MLQSLDPQSKAAWIKFADSLKTLESRLLLPASRHFAYVEGSLVKALRNGDWVLLDEINLAAPEVLDSIADLSR